MPIDKSWMQLSRSDPKYDQGVTEFLEYAYSHDKWVEDDMIICPCKVCGLNRDRLVRFEVHWHLLRYGIKPHYTSWNLHGEGDDDNNDESEDDSSSETDKSVDNRATPMELCDDMQDLIEEIFSQDPNEDAQRFYKLLEEAETPLYEGCKKEHKNILRMQHGDDNVEKLHNKDFVDWFYARIEQSYDDGKMSAHMMSLANVMAKKATGRKTAISGTEEIGYESQPLNAIGPPKKKGRGGAKGEKGHGMPANIHDGRIITPQATRVIFPLFKQELTGPYTTWPRYKKHGKNLTRVYERWQECNFKFTCSEEDVKNAFEKHIKNRYPDWMSAIRNSIFKKHKIDAARYANCSKGIKRNVWP
ncbi:hypothetical protein LguiB_006779 [Lonicera macranthoides]